MLHLLKSISQQTVKLRACNYLQKNALSKKRVWAKVRLITSSPSPRKVKNAFFTKSTIEKASVELLNFWIEQKNGPNRELNPGPPANVYVQSRNHATRPFGRWLVCWNRIKNWVYILKIEIWRTSRVGERSGEHYCSRKPSNEIEKDI